MENLSELFEPNTFGYNNLDAIYYTGWGISALDAVMLFFILKFMCFSSRIFKKKNTIKKQNSLITLFENNKHICIKCRTPKDDTTAHCILCNGCVEGFGQNLNFLLFFYKNLHSNLLHKKQY